MTLREMTRVSAFAGLLALSAAGANVELEPAASPAGYVTRLLINEVPFPGDPLYRSEKDSMRGMFEILWVLDNRVRNIPPGYTQWDVANTQTGGIIDVITAPGQVEDFFKAPDGKFTAAPRVFVRVDYLVNISNQGPPGRFARLLNYAQHLAQNYFRSQAEGQDLFVSLRRAGPVYVTGCGYAWMTADLPCEPGWNFVKIPNDRDGLLGANHFYTLRKEPW